MKEVNIAIWTHAVVIVAADDLLVACSSVRTDMTYRLLEFILGR